MCIYTHTYAYIHIYIIKQHSKIECAALLSDNNNSNAQMSRVKSPHLTTPHTTPHFALCPPQQRAERTTLHYTTLHIPHQPTPPQLSSPHPITHTHTHYIFPPHLTTSPPHHDSHSSIALSSSGGSSAATALTAVPIKCSTSISMLSPTQLLMFVCVCCCFCCAPVSSTKSKSTTVRSH